MDISAEARATLAETIQRLAQSVSGVRWARPEGIHLTLKFLGDVGPDLVDRILLAVAEAVRGTQPFELRLAALGTFPNPSNPRVVWMGLEGDLEPMAALQAEIEGAMERINFPREGRPFRPHLTLGRVREGLSPQQRRLIGETVAKLLPDSPVPWRVSEVRLIQSTLTPQGAVYHGLGAVPLGPNAARKD